MPTTEETRLRRRTRRRRIRRALEVLLVATAGYLAFGMLRELDWSSLESQVRQADIGLLGLTVALLLGRWLLWNNRWRLALRRVGVTSRRVRSLLALLAAMALNHLTPAFRILGGLARARYLTVESGPGFPVIYGAVLFDQIINQTVTGAMSAIAFIALSWRLDRPNQALAAVTLVIGVALLAPLLYHHLGRRGWLPSTTGEVDLADHVGRRLRPIAERSRIVLGSLHELFRDRSTLVRGTLLGIAIALVNIAAAWTTFAALGEEVAPSAVFFAVSLGVTIGAISGTPGGGLTTEAAMVTCYTLLGMDQTVAIAGTLLYRGLHYLLVLSLGLPSLIWLEASHRRDNQVRSAQDV